jgi:RNA polymerase sigma-70 factor (ECF subfamily)
MQEDNIYLNRLQKGDIEAFRCLFDQYHHKVFDYALRFVRNRQVAEELTSDAFMKLWNKRSQIKVEGSICQLLFVMTKGLAIDYLGKMAKTTESRALYLQNCEGQMEVEPINDLFEKNMVAIEEAIKKLPPKRKRVFELRYQEELSYQQIAQKLDVSPNTVKVHLNKATKYLKKQVQFQFEWALLVLASVLVNLPT